MIKVEDRYKGFKEIMEYDPEFYRIFGIHVNYFFNKSFLFIGMVDFDIIEFDKYMQKLGFRTEKDGSLQDYIIKEYGERASELIDELIRFWKSKL